MSTPARADISAHMEPRDAAMVTALARARETSISTAAATLIYGTMHRRGWRAIRPLEIEREAKLREALLALDDKIIQALIPTLPRNGPRSPLRIFLDSEDIATLVRMYAGTGKSMSYVARSMIEEALAYLMAPEAPVGPNTEHDHQSDDVMRVVEAIDTIKDPQLRQSFAATVERMAALCGGTAEEHEELAGVTKH